MSVAVALSMMEPASLRRVLVGLALAGCVFHGAGSTPAAGADLAFKVIVHPSQPWAPINREALSAVFLRKSPRWGDGTATQPVDQSAQSALREAFSLHVHGQPTAAVLRFWARQISDGRGVPPPVKTSDADVIAYVASKRGAIGYVSAQTPVPESVRTIPILD